MEPARIGIGSLADGKEESKNFKPVIGEEKREGKVGGAERNRTADEGFADPCLTTWLPRHPVLQRKPKRQKMKNPPAWASSGGLRFLGAEGDSVTGSASPHQKTQTRSSYSNKGARHSVGV